MSSFVPKVAVLTCLAIALLLSAGQPLDTRGARPDGRSSLQPIDTVVVFGPMTFSTPTGSAATHVETFSVADPTAPQSLRVEFGDPSGTDRPQTASVILNADTIATHVDFATGATVITEPVSVLTSNTLQVTVSGTAGAFVRVSLLSYDDGSILLFGPKTYQRSGSNKDVTDTIVLPPGTRGPYRIHLRSGDLNGSNRPSSAYVIVNGTTIFPTSDFKPDFGGAVREIILNTQNTITVGGMAPVGSRLTLRVTGVDDVAPQLSVTSPSDGVLTREAFVTATGTVQDASPVSLTINGEPVSLSVGGGFSVQVPLDEGPNTIQFVATDAAGNVAQHQRSVVRDATPPLLSVTAPSNGHATRDDSVQVFGTATDAGTVAVAANGQPLPVTGGGSFSGWVPLTVGENTILVTATDAADNQTSELRVVTRDTLPPVLVVTAPADSAEVEADTLSVSGTVADATQVTVTVNGQSLAVGEGAFGGPVPLVPGANVLTFIAVDAAGNQTTVLRHVTRTGGGSDLPPDPATVAPQLDRTMSTSMAAATEFLYAGTNPVQRDVAPGAIKPMIVAVLRGRVLERGGEPLSGVRVAVHDRPELGSTLTREDGAYDLAVNGGGIVVLDFTRDGYLPAQRHVKAPWRDYRGVDDVRLVQLDTAATIIDFSAPIQRARGSVVSDEDGTRQATMLFQQGTSASMQLPDGTSQPLTALTVRATEYTVGPNGPDAMPADLPQNTSYTYAAELSVDEALAAGATTVEFSQPVRFYVENFVGFPVGSAVPFGTYDRQRAAWIPEDNGRVIQVLDTAGGIAAVDVDGSGQAAGTAALQALQITNEELAELASMYPPGQSLWRTLHSHFSIGDWNWRLVLPEGALSPMAWIRQILNVPPCKTSGSVIGCESQTLGEDLEIAGTPFTLVYSSDRAPGRAQDYTLDFRLSGDSVPSVLKRIEVIVTVAGRTFKQTHSAVPNQTASFTWDGLDAYGRRPLGRQPVSVRIDYVYDGLYELPALVTRSFNYPGQRVLAVGALPRTEIRLTQDWNGWLGNWDARVAGLGGWTLSGHHALDGSVVMHGTGSSRSVASGLPTIRTYAGRVGGTGCNGAIENVAATASFICGVQDVEVGPDGALYIADWGHHKIRKVDPVSGLITAVAGNGFRTSSNGDGGPATAAMVPSPTVVKLGPDGSVYLIDASYRIRRVDPSGIIHHFAGLYLNDGYSGDGGPATLAQFNRPNDLAVARDGTVYVADYNNHRVRMISTDGIITTVAGSGVAGYSGDGGPANAARLYHPNGVAVTADGELIIADANNRRLRKVGRDGTIRTIAGSGLTCNPAADNCGDGGLATSAKLAGPHEIDIAPDGSIYFQDGARVRRIGTDGVISSVVGTGVSSMIVSPDGTPAHQINIYNLSGMAVAPDGSVYYPDWYHNRIWKVEPPIPGFHIGEALVAEEDGSVLHVLDTNGRHRLALHPLTRDTLLRFQYDTAGWLTGIQDGSGNITSVERDSTGRATAIVGPFGHRTTLGINADGFLESIANPNGETVALGYHAGGLLASMTGPRGHTYQFTYDGRGRLELDQDPASGWKALARTETPDGHMTTVTTAMGRATSYLIESTPAGDLRRSVTGPSGLTTTSVTWKGDTTRTVMPDSMSVEVVMSSDPRFGMQIPRVKNLKVTTPSGLTLTGSETREVTLATPSNPLSLTSATDRFIVNGRTYTRVYNAGLKQFTSTTPQGRQSVTRVDSQGRIIEEQVPGLTPVTYTYDSRGRLETVAQGQRTTAFAYDAQGNLQTVVSPRSDTASFQHDSIGRIIRQVMTGGVEITFAYDSAGNLTSLTPPSRPAHRFSYNAVDVADRYEPPGLGTDSVATRYVYNADRQLTRLERPDGLAIDVAYDTAGRVRSVALPNDSVHYSYSQTTGNLAGIAAPGGVSLSYTYDGSLPTSVSWSGPVSGDIGVSYNSNLEVTQQTVNGGNAVSFGYDNDGLLTSAGAMTLTRNPQNGLLTGTAVGTGTSVQRYSTFGELDTLSYAAGGTSLLHTTYMRDDLGRITQKVETVLGTATVHDYAYDAAGRLEQVWRDSVLVESYAYDANGNRTSFTDPGGTMTGTYDDQDRLLSYGDATYSYTANGDLTSRTTPSGTTTYDYDVLGNLRTVVLPDSTVIEYVIDGQNRRIGRKVSGALVQGFLYSGQLTPVAELDGGGNIVSRFVYGTRVNVPDYMIRGDSTYRIVTDHLGSVRLVVNAATGAVAQRIDYDAFGRELLNTAPGFQPFGFAGGIGDADTELVRFGSRDFASDIGRWTRKDGIGFRGGQSNLYVYSKNDPINTIDPSGYWGIAGAIYGMIAGGIGGYIAGGDVHSAIIGSIAGGAVGWAVPNLSANAGLAAAAAYGAAASGLGSIAGQIAGGLWQCRDFSTPIDFGAVGGAAIGGAIGGAMGHWIRGSFMGRPPVDRLGYPLPAPSGHGPAPFDTRLVDTGAALLEGAVGGVGERLGDLITPNSAACGCLR